MFHTFNHNVNMFPGEILFLKKRNYLLVLVHKCLEVLALCFGLDLSPMSHIFGPAMVLLAFGRAHG